jgi:glycosyltransferase involved in cell wall biosynthesis
MGRKVDSDFAAVANQLKPVDLPEVRERPLVSILVANYNYARFIGEAIESVLRQTYPNFEVIVCDDGSTDNSVEVVRTYTLRDSRIRLVSQNNGGVASALNAAYRSSRGEIVCLLDADDVFLPEKLERVVGAFRGAPRSGECIHRIIKMHADGRTFSYARPPFLVSGWVAPEALRLGGRVRNLPPASGLSFRRTVADLMFPVPTTLRRMVDAYISHTAQFFTEICTVEGQLAKQRIHEDNVTSSAGVTVPVVRRFLEDMNLVTQLMRETLTAHYGPDVASRLQVVDNAQYGNFLVALHLLDGNLGAQLSPLPLTEIVQRIQPRAQRMLAQVLLVLPRGAGRRALQLWTGQSASTALTVRTVRLLLGI